MFNEIWKKNILKPSSKVGIFKPKMGFELEEDKDDDCNKKLQEYANKLRNMSFKTKGSPQFNSYWEKQNESGIIIDETMTYKMKRYLNPDDIQSFNWEKIMFRYNHVPEEIACIALKYLKELKKGNEKYYNLELSKGYKFYLRWEEGEIGDGDYKLMNMMIGKKNKSIVHLSHYFHTAKTIGNYDEIDIDWR